MKRDDRKGMYSFKRDKAAQCKTTLGKELVKRPALRGRALSTDRLGLVEGMPYAPRPQYWSVLNMQTARKYAQDKNG